MKYMQSFSFSKVPHTSSSAQGAGAAAAACAAGAAAVAASPGTLPEIFDFARLLQHWPWCDVAVPPTIHDDLARNCPPRLFSTQNTSVQRL